MKIQHKIIGASVITGVFIWTIGAVLDFFFFQEGPFFKVLIFDIHPHHLYMRLVGIGSFIIFGIIVAKVVALRKRAEDALKMSEEKLGTMLKSIGDPISMMDKELNIIWANEVAKSIFGENIIDKKCYETFHGQKEPCKPSPCLALKVFQDGSVHEHDTQVKDKNGEIRYFHCTANVALKDNDGKPQAVVEISRDITEQKRAEHVLKIKDIAISSAINGVAFSDLEGNLTSVNESFLKMWGYEDEGEVIGKSVTSFWLEKDKIHKLIETMHSKGSWIGEHVGVKKDGSQFNVQISAHMVKNNGSIPICMMSSFVDITERKKAEEELVRYRLHLEELVKERTAQLVTSNEQLQQEITERKKVEKLLKIKDSAIASSINAVVLTDLEANIIYVNQSFLKMWRYSNEKEIIGKSGIWLGSDKTEVLTVIEILRNKGSWVGESLAKRKDGSTFTVQLSAHLVNDENGKPECMMASFFDITERKRSEKTLQESEGKYSTLVENAQDGVSIFQNGNIKFVNQAIEKIFGYTAEELIGKSFLSNCARI